MTKAIATMGRLSTQQCIPMTPKIFALGITLSIFSLRSLLCSPVAEFRWCVSSSWGDGGLTYMYVRTEAKKACQRRDVFWTLISHQFIYPSKCEMQCTTEWQNGRGVSRVYRASWIKRRNIASFSRGGHESERKRRKKKKRGMCNNLGDKNNQCSILEERLQAKARYSERGDQPWRRMRFKGYWKGDGPPKQGVCYWPNLSFPSPFRFDRWNW